MSGPLVRYVLAPLFPAALLATPVAAFVAESGMGPSWTTTFCATAGLLCLLWAGLRWREDRGSLRESRLVDESFGQLKRIGEGSWWGSVELDAQRGVLPISIAADRHGPSAAQRRSFEQLRAHFSELEAPLRSLLLEESGPGSDPESARLLSLELGSITGCDRKQQVQAVASPIGAWSVCISQRLCTLCNVYYAFLDAFATHSPVT